MALNTNDPALTILIGADESGATATRENVGSLGTTHNFTPRTNSGSPGQGVPTASDGKGGRAAITSPDTEIGGWTDENRELTGKIENCQANAHSAIPAFPLTSATDDFAIGCRFKMRSPYSDGNPNEDYQIVWGYGRDALVIPTGYIGYRLQDNEAPADGARLMVGMPGMSYAEAEVHDTGADWTSTGTPASYYLAKDIWYRVVVRVYYDGSTGALIKVYIYNESTGTTWTFTWAGAAHTTDWAGGLDDYRWMVGIKDIGTSASSAYALVDECWVYDDALTDSDATLLVTEGITIPWSEPTYRVADHIVRVGYAHENSTMSIPRVLPTGGMNPRHTVGVNAQRFRLRYENWHAGRPWSRRRTDVQFDSVGPFTGKRASIFTMPPTRSIVRLPGMLPPEAAVDARNVEYAGPGVRRRRGFKIRRDVDSSFTTGINSMFSWRAVDGSLFWLYKVGDAIFAENGTSAVSLDSGWPLSEHIVAAALDDRLIICSANKRVSWYGNNDGVDNFGEPAPTGGTLALTAGTLLGTYSWAYTFYDPTTGDETAPKELGSLSPSTQGALLSSLDTTPTDTRFTQQKIYRTVAGGATPDYYYIAVQNNAATFTDGGYTDGTDKIDEVNGDFITSVAPQDFIGCAVHQQRMFYWYDNQLWWSEANNPMRWLSSSYITTQMPITAVVSQGYRVIVFTRNTVEIVESDFVRDANGDTDIRRTVVANHVGCVGPHGVIDWDDDLYWMDRRGIFHLGGDRVNKLSHDIDNLFLYLNASAARNVSGAYNHIRNQLWWAVPMAQIQDDNTRFNTVIVLHPGEQPRWTIHELEASYVTQWDDDLNGIRFGIMDQLGIFKEMESYEGDGLEGDEDATYESDGDSGAVPAAGISGIVDAVVTVYGSPGWSTDVLRGAGVVLRDISTGTLYYYTVVSNTANTFTCNTEPSSNLGDGDAYYMGAMRSYEEPAEQDFNSPNRKVVTQIQTQFDDLTAGRFV